MAPACPPGKAYFKALITSSVTMRPRLTATSLVATPASAFTVRVTFSRSWIIEAPMLSHRSVK